MAIRNGILDYINELDDSKIQIVDSYWFYTFFLIYNFKHR
jgi:hypothetical protein